MCRRLIALGLLAALARPARAADVPEAARQRVAVLEYRGGVEQAPDLARRVGERLKKKAALTVIDVVEARRRADAIDRQVADCGGDYECVARVGRTLGTDEVLLVAMSQLGDVVVSLQRIDAARGRPIGSPVSAVLPATRALDDDQIDGWLRQMFPPEAFKRYGYIAISTTVAGAVVTVDGKLVGETPLDDSLRLPAPASYELRVTRPNRVSFTAPIHLVPDSTVVVNPPLPEAPRVDPWYRRWYPWVIVGAVVVGGAVGTAVYVTRPDDTASSGRACHAGSPECP